MEVVILLIMVGIQGLVRCCNISIDLNLHVLRQISYVVLSWGAHARAMRDGLGRVGWGRRVTRNWERWPAAHRREGKK